MKPAIWSVPAILMGLVVAFLGPVVVGWMVPVESLWTEADAVAKSQAAAELHTALHDHAGHDHAGQGSGGAHVHETAAGQDRASLAQAEYDRQDSRLKGVVARHGWMLFGVRIFGILLASAGVAGALAARQAD